MPAKKKTETFNVYVLTHPLFFLLQTAPAVFQDPKTMRFAMQRSLGVWGKRVKSIARTVRDGNGSFV